MRAMDARTTSLRSSAVHWALRAVSASIIAAAVFACGQRTSEESADDAGTSKMDAARADAGAADMGPIDTGTSDTGAADIGAADSGDACVPNVGATCTSTSACGGTVGCDGACTGGQTCDQSPGPCYAASGTCDATSHICVYAALGPTESCDDGDLCTHTDACDGAGSCAGTPITCANDVCADRSCNGTSECSIVPLGTPVYEIFDSGWDYSTQSSPGARIAYYAPIFDRTTYLLHAPGIGDRMQSLVTDEANTCTWCGCAAQCAYSYTGRTISLSATSLPGMVPVWRWVNSNPIQHRSDVVSPGMGWNNELLLGYACAGEP